MFMLPWRNWLARSAVNRKDGGSSPPGSDSLVLFVLSSVVFCMSVAILCFVIHR